jgi:ADP-ribosylglycohydrolase
MAASSIQSTTDANLAGDVVCDRIHGCLLGSALGDALGLYITSVLPADGIYPGIEHDLEYENPPLRRDTLANVYEPGEWSMHTEHAHIIIQTFLHHNGKNLQAQVFEFPSRLRLWLQQGFVPLEKPCRHPGQILGRILGGDHYDAGPYTTVSRFWAKWHGQKAERASNCPLTRSYAVGLVCMTASLEQTYEIANLMCCATHTDPRCIICSVVGAVLVRSMLLGGINTVNDMNDAIREAVKYWDRGLPEFSNASGMLDFDHDEFWENLNAESLDEIELANEQGGTGFVYTAFASGIFCLRESLRWRTASATAMMKQSYFLQSLENLVRRGGYANANGCFAGALMGCFLGAEGVPTKETYQLQDVHWLVKKACSFCRISGFNQVPYSDPTDAHDDGPYGGKRLKSPEEIDPWKNAIFSSIKRDELDDDSKHRLSRVDSWLESVLAMTSSREEQAHLE